MMLKDTTTLLPSTLSGTEKMNCVSSEVLLQEKELALEFSSAPGSWDSWVGVGVWGERMRHMEFRKP